MDVPGSYTLERQAIRPELGRKVPAQKSTGPKPSVSSTDVKLGSEYARMQLMGASKCLVDDSACCEESREVLRGTEGVVNASSTQRNE